MGASVRTRTVAWDLVIDEIRGSGLQVKDIAIKVGVAVQTLHNLYGGATREPCYSVGVALLKLRDARCRRAA